MWGVAQKRAMQRAVGDGFVRHVADRIVCQDRWGTVTQPQYEIAIPTHIAWCDYWASQPCEHGVADIEDCATCMAPDHPTKDTA